MVKRIVLLTAVALTAIWLAEYFLFPLDRCLDAGGSWEHSSGVCQFE